jgi:hypothetical protein
MAPQRILSGTVTVDALTAQRPVAHDLNAAVCDRLVTRRAFDIGMGFTEPEAGVAVVVEKDLSERQRALVAPRAVDPATLGELSGVGIPVAVSALSTAGFTPGPTVLVGLSQRFMTGRALGGGMLAAQRESHPAFRRDRHLGPRNFHRRQQRLPGPARRYLRARRSHEPGR